MRKRGDFVAHLSPLQVRDVIMAASPGRDRALLAIVYQFGLRRSEVRYLRRKDWDSKASLNGSLIVWRVKSRKRGKRHERLLEPDEKPLWSRIKLLLEEYLGGRGDYEEALFLGDRGPLGPQAVYYIFRAAAEKAGIPEGLRNPHVLRHSIATHQANMGASLFDIAGWLGHSSLTSTMVYAQVLTPRKEDLILRSEASHCFPRF